MTGGKISRERGPEAPAADFLKLLEYLKSSRGFDFSGYKLSSLMRRMQKRMQQIGVAGYADYVDYLGRPWRSSATATSTSSKGPPSATG